MILNLYAIIVPDKITNIFSLYTNLTVKMLHSSFRFKKHIKMIYYY